MIERSYHDMGGLPAGKVEPTEHDYAEWERRVDAMSVLLQGIKPGTKRLITVDERRRAIEMLPPKAYDAMTYYERWVVALAETLIQRGILTTEEMARKLEEVEKRTPYYIRGCVGEVERVCGAFPNPEELAQMRSGLPQQPLYRVRFKQKEVWPDYRGADADVVEIEIYQHWLEAA